MTIKTKYKIATYLIVLIVGFALGFMTYAKFFDNGTTIKKVVNKVRGKIILRMLSNHLNLIINNRAYITTGSF